MYNLGLNLGWASIVNGTLLDFFTASLIISLANSLTSYSVIPLFIGFPQMMN